MGLTIMPSPDLTYPAAEPRPGAEPYRLSRNFQVGRRPPTTYETLSGVASDIAMPGPVCLPEARNVIRCVELSLVLRAKRAMRVAGTLQSQPRTGVR